MSDFIDKIRATLKGCIEAEDMAEVYTDERDFERFSVGIVESVTQDTYCLASIDPEGRVDGRLVGRLDQVFRLSTGTEYLSALRLLYRGSDQIKAEMPSLEGYLPLDIQNSLRFALDMRVVVSLWDVERTSIMGFVKDFGKEFVEIAEVRRDGHQDGSEIFHLDQILRVEVGGQAQQARAFIHRIRMGL